MYPVSFVERNFSGSRFVLQTDFGAVVARDLNQRGALRREDIYSLGNSLRILVDLQLKEDNIFSSQWISISLFEHLKNGALGPLSTDGSTYHGSTCRSLSWKVQSNPILLFWVNYSDVSILEELTTPGTCGTFIFLLY